MAQRASAVGQLAVVPLYVLTDWFSGLGSCRNIGSDLGCTLQSRIFKIHSHELFVLRF